MQGNIDGLMLNPKIIKKKEKLVDKIQNDFLVRSMSGFLSTLNDEEEKDIELTKIQLDLEKQKELIGAEA